MSFEQVTATSGEPHRLRRLLTPKVVGGLVITVLAVVFAFQNSDRGRIHFLGFTVTARAWIWLLAVFVAGVIVGLLLPRLRRDES